MGKVCLNCGNEFKGSGVKFCSQSCNATYHNQSRIKTVKIVKECLGCGELTTSEKFCNSKCQQIYKRKLVFEAIENGDKTFETRNYKRYLIYKYGEKCMICGWCERNTSTNKVPIELEHMDGNSDNNSLDNLKLLCPNHHSLTPTYKNLNKGKGRYSRMERYNEGKSY